MRGLFSNKDLKLREREKYVIYSEGIQMRSQIGQPVSKRIKMLYKIFGHPNNIMGIHGKERTLVSVSAQYIFSMANK